MKLYEAIYSRRDVRRFRQEPVADDVLYRILDAAHHTGSVGFMQPWNFILIREENTKLRVKAMFDRENARGAGQFTGERQELYKSLKIEGILEAPLNLCVTCDRGRGGKVLGRNTILDTDIFSTCLAVQNLWLAARAEGVGVGWVSILDNAELSGLLELPATVVPVAYLCIGYPEEFSDTPMLEAAGWRDRIPLEEVVFMERFGGRKPDL
ncbi:MAG TPA: 5,6-dimethylbenzimidazole synthase [Nitrospinae bacterium]|nr:5,6-dimethylbenzimidazole synthase [Nitrospinota bacterium]